MKVHCIIFGVGSLLAIGLVQAGPPFVTDDPEPPPPGGWEINAPFILERTPGKTEMDALLFDFNYGLPDVQLKLEFPIKTVRKDGDGTAPCGENPVTGSPRTPQRRESRVRVMFCPCRTCTPQK